MIKIPELDSPIKKDLAVILACFFQATIPQVFMAIIDPLDQLEYEQQQKIKHFVESHHFMTSFIGLIAVVIIVVLTCKSIIKFWNALLIITCMCTILNLIYIIINTSFLEDCLKILGFCLLMVCGLFGHRDLGLGSVR
nr:hypothetical protein [uncultured Flavobacterium sp.]